MARFYFQGFDGKWYVADDHTGPSALAILQQRLDTVMQKIKEKEERDGQQTDDHLPQRNGKA